MQYNRTNNIKVDRHFVKEKLDSGLNCTPYVSTDCQVADMLTEGLSSTTFKEVYPRWEWKTSIHQLEGECRKIGDVRVL